MFNRPNQAKEGRDIVMGYLTEVKPHPRGFIAIIEDDEQGKMEIHLSRKQAGELNIEPLMMASGVVHENKSGRKWLVAEKVMTGDEKSMTDEDVKKWQELAKNQEERELQKRGIQLTPKHLRQDKKEVINKMDAAFQQLREKYRRGE